MNLYFYLYHYTKKISSEKTHSKNLFFISLNSANMMVLNTHKYINYRKTIIPSINKKRILELPRHLNLANPK